MSMGERRGYADEFCGDLIELMKTKYGFTIDDIYFSEETNACSACGQDVTPKSRTAHFTDEFLKFCFTFARRRAEVQSPNQTARMEVET